jgi:hypothetical protein
MRRTEAIGTTVATTMLVWVIELGVGKDLGDGVERARPKAHAAVAGEAGPAVLEMPAAYITVR